MDLLIAYDDLYSLKFSHKSIEFDAYSMNT